MKCRTCKETLLGKNKYIFCSVKCSNASRLKKRKIKCAHCKEIFLGGKSRKFCSVECSCVHRNGLLHKALIRGERGARGWRKVLFKAQNGGCAICERKTWNKKPIPLELDHIDGNSERNVRKNLRLICPNCHAQTETYKGKNRGKGRHFRRERYKQGKSF